MKTKNLQKERYIRLPEIYQDIKSLIGAYIVSGFAMEYFLAHNKLATHINPRVLNRKNVLSATLKTVK